MITEKRLILYMVNLSRFGGNIRRIRLWLENLDRAQPFTLIYTPAQGISCRALLETSCPSGVELQEIVPPFRRMKWVATLLSAFRLLLTVLRSRTPVVVSMLAYSNLLAHVVVSISNLVPGSHSKHVIYSAGSPFPYTKLASVVGRIVVALLGHVYRNAAGVIVLSQSLREGLQKGFRIRLSRIKVVPISVECPEQCPQRERGSSRLFVFGVLARLHPEKSIDHVIVAFMRIQEEQKHVRLEIIGDGPDRERLMALVNARNLPREVVIFRGWASDPYKVLHTIDCLVLSSMHEGTPRSILEAGCMGVPSIAASVGGVPDLIQDGKTGWLYPYGDMDMLVSLMKKVVSDRELTRETGRRMQEEVRTERLPRREAKDLMAAVRHLAGA